MPRKSGKILTGIIAAKVSNLPSLQCCCFDITAVLFFLVIPAIAQWWSGIDVHLYLGQQELAQFGKEKAIVVMNHKGELDWVISWICSDHFRVLQVYTCLVLFQGCLIFRIFSDLMVILHISVLATFFIYQEFGKGGQLSVLPKKLCVYCIFC